MAEQELTELTERFRQKVAEIVDRSEVEPAPEVLEAAAALLESLDNADFMEMLARRDSLGSGCVYIPLAMGVRDDLPGMGMNERVILRISRCGRNRDETVAELIGWVDLDYRMFMFSPNYSDVAFGWTTENRLINGVSELYEVDGYEFEVTSPQEELGEWTGYLWRTIDTKEILAVSHGSRLAEMIGKLQGRTLKC